MMKSVGWKVMSSLLVLVCWVVFTAVTLAQSSYVVQPGDTLYRIAQQFGTTVAALQAANHIANANLIYVGQVLTIPGGNGSVPPPAATAVPPANPPAPPPNVPPSTGTTYVVQPGDTLYRIAVRFGVTVQAIAAANNIYNVNLIAVGQVLTIPGGSSSVPPPMPTAVPPVSPTAPPPLPPSPPVTGSSQLTNGSFEGGWYHPGNLPELQIPDGWVFAWDEGPTGFGNAPWDVWLRPEVRVLPSYQLPPQEQGLFIFDGNQTVKAFKGSGAVSFRLLQDVVLTPGTYRFEAGVFPDLVSEYVNGQKIRPSDPTAGEVRFIVGGGGTGWLMVAFGQQNRLTHTFTITQTQTVRLGLAVRGKYALNNNGWFLDAWSLVRIQ